MSLLVSVDDLHNAAYKTLAERWRNDQGVQGRVLVEFHSAGDIETSAKMARVVASARRKRCSCVMFVVDQESHDPSKQVSLRRIQHAFEGVCADPPIDMTIGLIIACSCLESWLLADVCAIVRYQAGKRGVNYAPRQSGRTEDITPPEAMQQIQHIMRETAKRRGTRDSKRVKYEKSRSGEIAQQIEDLADAAKNNRSLRYFLDMVVCDRDGCEHRQAKRD